MDDKEKLKICGYTVYKADLTLSKELYERNKAVLKRKDCFTNSGKIALSYLARNPEASLDLNIVFGAWGKPGSVLLAKHCFFMKNDMVIDPAIFLERDTSGLDFTDSQYIPAVQFSIQKYVQLLEECERNTNLDRYTEIPYRDMHNNLMRGFHALLG